MDVATVKQHLEQAGFKVEDESRNGNDTGYCLRLASGQLVNVFDTGSVNVQGRDQEPVKQLLGLTTGQKPRPQNGPPGPVQAAPTKKKVFVVYGHDMAARNDLEAMLRRWDLEPLILDQLPSEGQTIIEKLENTIDQVEFGVVLATPDDEGHRRDHPDEKVYRARQNVVLELGMLLTRLGRSKVAIILKDQVKMERPSDIQGLIYIPYKDNLSKEVGVTLAKELAAAGYHVDISKL